MWRVRSQTGCKSPGMWIWTRTRANDDDDPARRKQPRNERRTPACIDIFSMDSFHFAVSLLRRCGFFEAQHDR